MKNKMLLLFVIIAVLSGCETSNRYVKVSRAIDADVPKDKIKVISVMKFEDLTVDTTKYKSWSSGISDQVMESLGAIPYYSVISRNYTVDIVMKEQEFQLLGATDVDSAVKLGNLLNAQYIVVGSYQVMGNFIQINSKVMTVETGQLVVQASVMGPIDQFFIHQNEIALRICQGMNLFLSPEVQKKLLARCETKVVEASLANYQGQEKMEEITVLKKKGETKKIKEIARKAEEDFNKAVNLDKDYKKALDNKRKVLGSIITL